jgi:hypothetical protein
MGRCADNGYMTSLLIIGFIFLVGPLALLVGVDSRPVGTRSSRRWI